MSPGTKGTPSYIDNFSKLDRGLDDGSHVFIPILIKIYEAYFSYDKILFTFFTSILENSAGHLDHREKIIFRSFKNAVMAS